MSQTNLSSNKRVVILVIAVALLFAIGLLGDDYRLAWTTFPAEGGNVQLLTVIPLIAPGNVIAMVNPGPASNFFELNCSGSNGLGAFSRSFTLQGQTNITMPFQVIDATAVAGGGTLSCGGNFGTLPNTDYQTFQFKVPVQTFGFPQDGVFNDFIGDPVSSGTGELYQAFEPDLSLGGPLPLFFQRYYGSLTKANGVTTRLGNNWVHNFEWVLNVSGSSAIVNFFSGKAIGFTKVGNNWVLSAPSRVGYQFATTGTNTYQLLDPRTNLIYTFSGTGSTLGLTQIQDRNGNTLTIVPPSNGTATVTDGLGRTLTFTYDSSGRVISVADQSGRTVSFGYTGSDLTRFTDANGKSETYAYTTASVLTGLMMSRTLPLGNKTQSQTFDKFGRVVTETDSRNNTTVIAYDQPAGTTSYKDPLGAVTTETASNYSFFSGLMDANSQSLGISYDASGRRNSVVDRLGNKIAMTYHSPSGYPASITDAAGATTTYTWTAQVQGPFTYYVLTQAKFADGTSMSITYDVAGNPISVIDASGKAWKYVYNPRGQLISITDPNSHATIYAYNTNDATLATVTDPSGYVVAYVYDTAKRVAQIKYPDGSSRSFNYDNRDNVVKGSGTSGNTYNDNNHVVSSTDVLGKTSTIAYDSNDQISKETDRTGASTSFTYNENDFLKTITTPAGETYSFGYDALHRQNSLFEPSGNGFTYGFDKEGGLILRTDALSRKSSIARDALGRPVQFTTPLGEKYTVAYDSLSRETSRTDSTGRSVTSTYEARSLLSGISIGGLSTSLGYDSASLLTSLTDPNGGVWSFGYTNANLPASRTDPLKRATTYSYDKRNRISGAQTPAGSVAFSYDGPGHLVRGLFGDGTDFAFTYDADGRLLTAPGIALAYDAEGRIVTSNGLAITRDADGRIASITYGQGKTVTYTYNAVGLLASVTDWIGGSTTFTYDAAHELLSIKRPNGLTTKYGYDGDGRVAGITDDSGWSVTITRDAAGRVVAENRTQPLSPSPAPGILPLTYDAADQVSGFTYDGMGRLTADTLRTYTWNGASQLTGYSGADGSLTASYDALGLRTSTTQQATTLNHNWNYATGIPSLATVSDASGDRRYYIYAPDGSLLYAIDAATRARHFYHFDEIGSTVVLTDDSGAVTDSYSAGPYGESVAHSGSTDNPFTWQGQLGVMQEGSTSLFYMRARYFDSATARFLSPDSVVSANPVQMNPYEYALLNPLSYADPAGAKPVQYVRLKVNFVEIDRAPATEDLIRAYTGSFSGGASLSASGGYQNNFSRSFKVSELVRSVDSSSGGFDGFLNSGSSDLFRDKFSQPSGFCDRAPGYDPFGGASSPLRMDIVAGYRLRVGEDLAIASNPTEQLVRIIQQLPWYERPFQSQTQVRNYFPCGFSGCGGIGFVRVEVPEPVHSIVPPVTFYLKPWAQIYSGVTVR